MTNIVISDLTAQGRANLMGAACAAFAMVCFSTNDALIKLMSGDYALHQIVLIRSVIALGVFLGLIMPLTGGWVVFRTRRLGVHILRGCCVVFANMCFFLGLAVLPLADAVAIFFVAPLIITAFSVYFLGESVGPRRWAAVGMGLLGVIIMMRPGSGGFQMAALLPLAAAFGYASLHILTRRIGVTESAATMTVYIQLVFIAVSGAIGLALGHGAYANEDGGVLAFLLRAWVWPAPRDWWLLVFIGFGTALGGFFISQAYRISEAAFAAPFEYVAMPMAVFWGVMLFGTWPDGVSWIGMAFILAGGLFLLFREARTDSTAAPRALHYRR